MELFLDQKNNRLRTPVLQFLLSPWVERFALRLLRLQLCPVVHRLSLNLKALELALHLLDSKEDNWSWCGLTGCSGKKYALHVLLLTFSTVMSLLAQLVAYYSKKNSFVFPHLLNHGSFCSLDLDSSRLISQPLVEMKLEYAYFPSVELTTQFLFSWHALAFLLRSCIIVRYKLSDVSL